MKSNVMRFILGFIFIFGMGNLAFASIIDLKRVDIHDRIYPDVSPTDIEDRYPGEYYDGPISVPRGGKVAFQFAVDADNNVEAVDIIISPILRTTDNKALDAVVKSYHLLTVHVEGNTTETGVSTAGEATDIYKWGLIDNLPYLARETPFDVAEVLEESALFSPKANSTEGILLDVEVAEDALPGVYEGKLQIGPLEREFSLRVHQTVLDGEKPFIGRHFSPNPEDLTNGTHPEWWSNEHYDLLRNSGLVLKDFGTSSIQTPLCMNILNRYHSYWKGQKFPYLVKPITDASGTVVDFDFSEFDKWITTFRNIGFEYFDGESLSALFHYLIAPRKLISLASEDIYFMNYSIDSEGDPVFPALDDYWNIITDDSKNKREKRDCIIKLKSNPNSEFSIMQFRWKAFIGIFFQHLGEHLEANNWENTWIQRLINETRLVEDYEELSDLFRHHVREGTIANQNHGAFIEEIFNPKKSDFSENLDMWFMPMDRLEENQILVIHRKVRGLKTGLYTMVSPTPPWPSYHLDSQLTNSRLFGWLLYLYNCDAYDNWANNVYRGQDPIKCSIGPGPAGQNGDKDTCEGNIGHSPGDNWQLYRGPNGLRPSMRLISERDGFLDWRLLQMLSKQNETKANSILATIAQSGKAGRRAAKPFHEARKHLLDALDQGNVYNPNRSGQGYVRLDFDDDDCPDFLTTGGSKWYVLYGNQDEKYWSVLNKSIVGLDEMAFGDFDGDGKTDVFRTGGGEWLVSYGGTGNWEVINQSVISLERMNFGDFDGDGKTDVLHVTNGGEWKVSYGGTENWEVINQSVIPRERMNFGDFDGDGKTDVLHVTNGGEWKVSYGGTENWEVINQSVIPRERMNFGYFNDDEKTDVFYVTNGGEWKVSYGGTENWEVINQSIIRLDEMAFGDFDGDSITDIYRRDRNDPNMLWISFGGRGNWEHPR